jgi:hypothetical protein
MTAKSPSQCFAETRATTYLDESTIRSRARRRGFRVHRAVWAGYMLLEADTNFIVLGHRFDATLEEIETFLREVCNKPN